MSIPPTRRTVAYIRVSSEDQATEGYSLGDQERAIRLTAQARVAMQEPDWTEIAADGVYCDAGVSGATRDRPALTRLLADARAGKVGRVVCTKLDRMSRRAVDLLAIEEDLEQYGVERIYIKDSIDTSTPTGRLLRTVLAAVAELERDLILERTRAGMVEKVAQKGEAWRSRNALGYRYVPRDKETGTPGHLEIDEAMRPLVRRIFETIAGGGSATQLAADLTREGVPTPRGAKYWHPNAILWMIHNPLYTGQASWGRLVRAKNGSPTKRVWAESPHYASVPAIVERELAEAARAQLARNLKTGTRRPTGDYLLSQGLLVCDACTRTMGGSAGGRKGHRYYRCLGSDPVGMRRVHRSLPAPLLEDLIWSTVAETLRHPGKVLADAQALADADSAHAAALEQELTALDRQDAELARQESSLLDAYLSRKFSPATLDAKSAQLAEQRRRLHDRAAALMAQRDDARARTLPIEDTEALCAAIAAGLEALDHAGRRRVVRLVCHTIRVTADALILEGALPASATLTSNPRPAERPLKPETAPVFLPAQNRRSWSA
jgi:site-specific DNA recombinase